MNPIDLSTVDRAVLATMLRHGITDDSPHEPTSHVLGLVRRDHGIAQVHSWEALLTLGRRWELQHPLIDFVGNFGTPSDPPADARYTQVRLTPLGRFSAEASDRGEVCPTALVMGDVCRGGMRPPLRSENLLTALRALLEGGLAEADVRVLLHDPAFPTGAVIRCDTALLLSGSKVMADVSARMDWSEPGVVRLEGFAPGVGATDVFRVVRKLAENDLSQFIVDTRDDSDGVTERLVVRYRPPEMESEVVGRLAQQWPIRIQMELGFGADLPGLLQAWVAQFATPEDAHSHLVGFDRCTGASG